MKYNSEFKFVNTHLGPFDIFGNIKIDGKMTKKAKQSYMYKGNMKFLNLWLNEEKLDSLVLKYVVLNKKFIRQLNLFMYLSVLELSWEKEPLEINL